MPQGSGQSAIRFAFSRRRATQRAPVRSKGNAMIEQLYATSRCPTFPARPVNGGSLDTTRERFAYCLTGSVWYAEPKYNGWRAMVHIETGAMFNRHGKRLSITGEFKAALDTMRVTLDAGAFKWADVEALERRHGIGKGCLIVLDVIPEPQYAAAMYQERRAWLGAVLPMLPYTPDPAHFPLLSIPPLIGDICKRLVGVPESTEDLILEGWRYLQNVNRTLGGNARPASDFYEGIVMKKANAPYPIQLRSDNAECAAWVKHRWDF
jgi:hypothetical protein